MIRPAAITQRVFSYCFLGLGILSFLFCCGCYILVRLLVKPLVFVCMTVVLVPMVFLELFRKK